MLRENKVDNISEQSWQASTKWSNIRRQSIDPHINIGNIRSTHTPSSESSVECCYCLQTKEQQQRKKFKDPVQNNEMKKRRRIVQWKHQHKKKWKNDFQRMWGCQQKPNERKEVIKDIADCRESWSKWQVQMFIKLMRLVTCLQIRSNSHRKSHMLEERRRCATCGQMRQTRTVPVAGKTVVFSCLSGIWCNVTHKLHCAVLQTNSCKGMCIIVLWLELPVHVRSNVLSNCCCALHAKFIACQWRASAVHAISTDWWCSGSTEGSQACGSYLICFLLCQWRVAKPAGTDWCITCERLDDGAIFHVHCAIGAPLCNSNPHHLHASLFASVVDFCVLHKKHCVVSPCWKKEEDTGNVAKMRQTCDVPATGKAHHLPL